MTTNIPQNEGLVKYADAVLVSTSAGRGKGKDKRKDTKNIQDLDKNIAHTEDILNSILPPREYTLDKQQLMIQSVLSTPATKADVVKLQEDLEALLQQKQARETGICPIREELYAQCFDELIRQITINCSERGLLLVRVRDEIRMTIQAHQTLYESSIALAMRKALLADQKKNEMNNRVQQLEREVAELNKQLENVDAQSEQIETNELRRQEQDEKSHRETIEFLKKANQKFKDELEKVLSGPKK